MNCGPLRDLKEEEEQGVEDWDRTVGPVPVLLSFDRYLVSLL